MTPHCSLQVDEAFRLLVLIATMVNKLHPLLRCEFYYLLYVSLFVVITISERSFMVFHKQRQIYIFEVIFINVQHLPNRLVRTCNEIFMDWWIYCISNSH